MDDYKNKDLPFEVSEEKVDDRRIVRMVRTFMKKSDEYRREHLELADRCRERYQNWTLEEKSRIRRANLKPSYGFTIIETLVPQLCQLFFGDENIVKFFGKEHQDFQFEDALTDFTDMQFNEMDFEVKSVSFFKNMLLDGTAVAKIPYVYREQDVVKRVPFQDPETGQVIRTKELVAEVMYDGPDMVNIPLYDFFPDWQVKEPGNIKKMRGVVHRMYLSYADIKNKKKRKLPDGTTVGIYENFEELELSWGCKGDRAWQSPYWSDDFKSRDEWRNGDSKHIKDSDKIEVWEYWGLADLDGSGELQESIITIMNGDVVMRRQENFYDTKFKPFVACPNYIRPNEFYGIPELAAVDSEIREATAIRNARLDQINLGVNQMWLVDRAGGIDTKNLYSRPGGIIYTNDINALKPIAPGDPSASSAQELAAIETNIAQASAMGSAPIVGASKSFARSATGVNYLEQFASSRLGLKAKMLKGLYFKPVVDIMMLENQQFVEGDQWVRATDPESPNPFNLLPSDAFYRSYDYEIKTKFDLPEETQYQKLQAVAQVAQVAEQSQPGSVKMDVLLEAILRPMVGPQVKKFMRTPQELQQLKMENAALRVQEQAANAQIGANAPQPNALNPVQS